MELEAELERLRRYFESNAEGIWCFELEPPVSTRISREEAIALWMERGRLIECNDALAQMYGYNHAHELVGTPLRAFIDINHGDNLAYLCSFWDSGFHLRDGESAEIDRAGNERTFLNTMLGVLRGDDLLRVWGTQRDITPNRMLEAQRFKAQRLQAVEELAAGVAHHFNNMLTIISGNLNLILENAELAADDLEALQSAGRAAEHAAALTRQLLNFSQRHHPNFEPVEIRATVQAACQLLRPRIHDKIRLDLDLAEIPRVLGDSALIQQIVVVLIQNARVAMRDRGVVHIRLRSETTSSTQELVTLEVRHEERRTSAVRQHPVTFDPFFSGAPAGSDDDYSLAEVYGIVRNLSGTLTARSEARQTRIRIQIPAERSAPAPPGGSTRLGARHHWTQHAPLATVLVVEDDSDVLATVRRFVLASGYRVLTARNAFEGATTAERHRDRIHILISDVVMPDKSGVEFAREFRAQRPDTQILLMTGRGTPTDLGPDLSGVEVIAKPFSREDLDRKLKELLDRE